MQLSKYAEKKVPFLCEGEAYAQQCHVIFKLCRYRANTESYTNFGIAFFDAEPYYVECGVTSTQDFLSAVTLIPLLPQVPHFSHV